MNSFEKLLSVLKGEKIGERCFGLNLSLYGSKFLDCDLKKYYTDPNLYFLGQKKLHDILKQDIILAPFILTYQAQAFGSKIKYYEHQPPYLKEHVIRNLDEFDKFKKPDLKKSKGIQFILESTKLLSKEYKNRVGIANILLSPFSLPILIMGTENWIETICFHKDRFKKIIEVLTEHFFEYLEEIKKAGGNFVVLPESFLSSLFITRDIFMEMIYPKYLEIFSKIDIPVIIHHGGYQIYDFIDIFNKIPNIAGFIIDHRDDYRLVREKIDKNKIVLGKLDSISLHTIKREKIIEKCKSVLDETRDDLKFIFSSSNSDILLDTSIEKIKSIRDTVKNYKLN